MATTLSTFRSLGAGIKFDVKRFRADAEKFKLIRPQKTETEPGHDQPKTIPNQDGVGTKRSNDAGSGGPPQKKKRRRKKRKKTEDTSGESANDSAIQFLSSQVNQTQDSEEGEEEDETAKEEEMKNEREKKLTSFLKQHKISVNGTDIPDPIREFSELQGTYRIHQDIIENIHRQGYATPTPIQMQAIPVMLQRRELLACAPTGSGKTAAFILPILHQLKEPRNQGFRAVILSPTRELASQTFRELQRLSEGRQFRIHLADKFAKAAKIFKKGSRHKYDILVATPNRLVYMLKQEPPVIMLKNVEWLVIDESDKLFETGKHGFREQLATIYQACDSARIRRALFSATYAHEVENWCKLNLDNVVEVTVGHRNTATDLIKQELMFVGGEYGKLLAVREIFNKGFQPPVLIFVQSKDRAKELFHELIYDGFNVDVIHADKSQEQRDNIIKSFRAGKIWVLIATELMGRGIDFKGVNLVINYDFPASAISYIHRIGRTGRAGRPGRAVTLFTEDDSVCLRSIANVMKNAGCDIPDYMLQLKKMNKKDRARLERKPIERESIRTGPYFGKNKKSSSKTGASGEGEKSQSTGDKPLPVIKKGQKNLPKAEKGGKKHQRQGKAFQKGGPRKAFQKGGPMNSSRRKPGAKDTKGGKNKNKGITED